MLEHLLLGVKLADLVVQQGILLTLFHPRRAADDDHGRLLGKGLGGGIGELQSAYAVRDADGAQAAYTGVGIGGETGALLVASVDEAQFAPGKLVVESKHVIARDAKHMAHPMRVEPLDEVIANGG